MLTQGLVIKYGDWEGIKMWTMTQVMQVDRTQKEPSYPGKNLDIAASKGPSEDKE